ncbi:MarC family NAAT transporter [Oscillatoria laete-virens NRMC-F 0139]|nr:MarC family NAAT transporter [Oscillatoria laete-virens]MDL5054623.1 MarC family NAAT transporter [Oscillatoria laete-virens NRMC-F 0139]
MTIHEFIQYYLWALAALFPMVNPFSTIPLLLALTAGEDDAERKRQARKACRNAGIITLFLGGVILEFFNISIPAIRVAGGLIVAYIGFYMLFPKETADSPKLSRHKDHSLIPLALPSMAGAGTLATILTFSSEIAKETGWIVNLLGYTIAVCAILTVVGLSMLVLRAATRINRALGPAGLEAMAKIMGLLLVCIGVQFIANGIREFMAA